MIPRIVHRIWLGEQPMPALYERYWRAWSRQLPDVDFRTWRDDDVARLPLAGPLLKRAASTVQRADISRYDIVLQQGGMYLDCDIMPLTYADLFSGDELLTCNENAADEVRSIGFFAAPEGHPTLRQALTLIASSELGRAPPNIETGPALFRRAIVSERRLPTAAFYPYHHTEPFSRVFDRDLSSTWGIHVWGRTWLPSDALMSCAARCIAAGDIAEAAELLARCPTDETEERVRRIQALCSHIRALRASLIAGLRTSPIFVLADGGIHSPARTDRPTAGVCIRARPGVPSLLEAGWHVLNRDPNAVVWQIGACDGIMADCLRPLMVNFDPNALLVEPNPAMYTRLTANYRRNERAQLANVAVGSAIRSMELIAVDPDLAAKDELPDWAIGLSSLHADRNALGGKTVSQEMKSRLVAATRRIAVEVLTPAELRRRHDIGWPDILVVDTEGSDAEVVKAFLDAEVRPKIIYFETICLPDSELAALQRDLASQYALVEFPQNMMAVRHDVLDELVSAAFVEQGRRTLLHLYGMDLVVPPALHT